GYYPYYATSAATSAATWCHVLPRGTTWLPRGSGDHHLTRALNGGQPPLTGGDRWSDGGRLWFATVDSRWPSLTTAVDHR
ncbi:hypothetical protein Tco_0473239, partial [Tanacetum coccineum]